MQWMQSERHTHTPNDRMWRKCRQLETDAKPHSKNATNGPREHPTRMANTSSDESVASSKTQSSIMATHQICVLHNRKTPITKPARTDGFLEKIEVKIVPTFTSEKASGKLSDGPRHATVRRPCVNNLDTKTQTANTNNNVRKYRHNQIRQH